MMICIADQFGFLKAFYGTNYFIWKTRHSISGYVVGVVASKVEFPVKEICGPVRRMSHGE
jgi:hypothetical protein